MAAACLAAPTAQAHTVCTLLADGASERILLQEGTCGDRVTPASTFKLAISLMGYDAGFLRDETHPALPYQKSYPAPIAAWRMTIDPSSWMTNSVVWYSQQITRHLGAAKFRHYVDAFAYGNRDVSGDPGRHNGLTKAWLSSSLAISPLEQIAFLRAIVTRRLPVSAHAYAMTDRITRIETLPSGWDIHGKTGTAFLRRPDGGQDPDHGYGWFVGWATRAGETRVFARLIQDDGPEPGYAGPRARAAFLAELRDLLPSDRPPS